MPLLEPGVNSERVEGHREIGSELKTREISFLTSILGRTAGMTSILRMLFFSSSSPHDLVLSSMSVPEFDAVWLRSFFGPLRLILIRYRMQM